ncbi:MAG: hypothetical protein JST10_08595 [Bacteroidetes bacterium]|nr:hypothetical protein [Bacteroidota bacterium]MBS1632616.1 hypothetical protein [Bacteroidota bacterium]
MKQVLSNNILQTMKPNGLFDRLCNGGSGFSDSKKEKSSKNAAQFCVVTPSGFKPETF